MPEILYNKIGDSYNSTRAADNYIVKRLIELLDASTEKQYLDIGCGTGNYTIALSERGINLKGVDPSEKMLSVAKEKSNKIDWAFGSAENIPFENDFFDGVMGTLTMHHWTDLEAAFKELYRVTKPKGALVFFTSTPEQMKGYWLNHYFPNMLEISTEKMPSLERVSEALQHAGLKLVLTEKYFVKDDLQDHFLHVGKNNPRIYFNETIRNGISSFANLSNEKEVKEGLSRLDADIQSGQFEKIKKQYENDFGDYLFMKIEKG